MNPRAAARLAWHTARSDIVDVPLRVLAPGIRERTAEVVDGLLAGRADALVIDLLTGTGSWLAEWASRNPQAGVIAVDINPKVLAVARARVEDRGFFRLDAMAADARETGLPACSADVVTIAFGLHENSSRDRSMVLGEACRLLREGGRLVITDYRETRGAFRKILARAYFRLFEPVWIEEIFNGRMERQVAAAGFALELIDTDIPMTRMIVARK